VVLDAASIQTNIVVFGLAADAPPAGDLVARARERGVLINALNPSTIRLVTHLDAPLEACERAATLLLEILED
jgi:threonine aldolase